MKRRFDNIDRRRCEACAHLMDSHVDAGCIVCNRLEPQGPCARAAG